jgi:hypothetical protein
MPIHADAKVSSDGCHNLLNEVLLIHEDDDALLTQEVSEVSKRSSQRKTGAAGHRKKIDHQYY